MRREPSLRPENILVLAVAEINRIKALLSRITDGRVIVIATGTSDGGHTTPPVEAGEHTLYGVKHTRAFRLTDGGGLTLNFDQGQVWVGGSFFSVAAGSLAMTDATTNYVFINVAGAVADNVTGFPADSIPLATVVTAGADITSINDRRSYLSLGMGAALAHDILSVTHPDTLAAAVARGDTIIGNPTPEWASLPIGAADRVYKSDGIDPAWGQVGHDELTDKTASDHHAKYLDSEAISAVSFLFYIPLGNAFDGAEVTP